MEFQQLLELMAQMPSEKMGGGQTVRLWSVKSQLLPR